jgi:hypothetical protein
MSAARTPIGIDSAPDVFARIRRNEVKDMMRSTRNFATVAALAATVAGCMHNRTETMSGGDVAIDSLTAVRTGLLRVQNDYSAEVRIYAINGNQKNYIAKAMPGEARTFVLDPNLFPANAISFEARAADNATAKTVGPFKVTRGETVDLVIPKMIENASATVHRSVHYRPRQFI